MDNHEDLILFGSGLDQSLPTGEESAWLDEQIDVRVQESIRSADLNQATALVRNLIKATKIFGKQVSKVLYQFYINWEVFGAEETFEEWADRETGLHAHTIERYVRIEKMLHNKDIEESIRKELADKNLTELFPIANMIDQGYVPDQEQWGDILIQPDEVSIRAKVRDIKGQEPRPTGLTLHQDSNGSLWAIKEGTRKFFGSLEISDPDPMVQQAIERVLRNGGILR